MDTAIIFDMDGTLFQTNLILEPALEATFEQLRESNLWVGETPIETYRNIMGVPLSVVWETLCPEHPLETRVESNRLFQLALIEQIQQGRGALYSDVEETLQKLSQYFPLFIASNGQSDYLHAIVETYGLNKWIKGVYSIDIVPSGNKSELVAIVVAKNKITGGYVVGDRSSDINAALDNQLLSIGVRFDFAQEAELIKANFIVNEFKNISDIVLHIK